MVAAVSAFVPDLAAGSATPTTANAGGFGALVEAAAALAGVGAGADLPAPVTPQPNAGALPPTIPTGADAPTADLATTLPDATTAGRDLALTEAIAATPAQPADPDVANADATTAAAGDGKTAPAATTIARPVAAAATRDAPVTIAVTASQASSPEPATVPEPDDETASREPRRSEDLPVPTPTGHAGAQGLALPDSATLALVAAAASTEAAAQPVAGPQTTAALPPADRADGSMIRLATRAPGAPADGADDNAAAFDAPVGAAPAGDRRPGGSIHADRDGSAPEATPSTPAAPLAALPFAAQPVAVTPPATTAPATVVEPQVAATPGTFGQDLGVQIAHHVSAGHEHMTVRLSPANMGRIDIRLSFTDDGSLRAAVRADSHLTLDLLRREAADLGRSLADAGIRADVSGFSFARHGGTDAGAGQSPYPQQGESRRSRGEPTDALADDRSPDEAAPFRSLRGGTRINLMA